MVRPGAIFSSGMYHFVLILSGNIIAFRFKEYKMISRIIIRNVLLIRLCRLSVQQIFVVIGEIFFHARTSPESRLLMFISKSCTNRFRFFGEIQEEIFKGT